MKSGNLNFLEPSGPLQACIGTALRSEYISKCSHTFHCEQRSPKSIQGLAKSLNVRIISFFPLALWAVATSFLKFIDHTQRRTSVGKIPLDGLSARRRKLYLTTHFTGDQHPCLRRDSNLQPSKGRITLRMPFPCPAHAVPLPCRAAKGLECVFPI